MAWGPRSEGATSGGLASLPSTLLAGALVLVVVAAAVAFVPLGSLSGGGLVVTGPTADATTEPAEEGGERDGLEVAVRGPRRLVPRHPAPLEVRVSDQGGALRLDGRRLLLTFDLEKLDPEARGWVMVDPARVLVRAEEVGEQRIELRGFGELPCGDEVGTLHVTAQELVEDGRTATTELTVPGQACDQSVPTAPDTVHQLEAPAPTPPARSTRPAPRPDDDQGAADDEADEGPPSDADPSDDEGDTEPDDEAGDGEGSTPDDAVDGIVDTDGDDTSGDDGTDGTDDTGGDGGGAEDGSEGTEDSATDDGGSDGSTDGTDSGDTADES